MRRAICLTRAYRDTACITAVLVCVINAIFNIALYALYMLRGIALTLIIKLFVFHFISPF